MPAKRAPGQGSLRQRGDRWISQTRHPLTGKIVSKTHPAGTSPKQAEKLHAAWLADVHRARMAPTGITVRQHLDDWLAARDDVAPNTVLRNRSEVAHLSRLLGGLRLSELHAGHIVTALAELRKTLSDGSVARIRATLSSALAAAEAWDRLERNPMRKVPKQRRRTRPKVVVPTTEQVRKIVAGEPDLMFRAAWLALALGGMRVGELLATQWGDVDLDGGVIQVDVTMTYDADGHRVRGETTKTRVGRAVYIGADVVAALRAWRAELAGGGLWRVGPDAPVFESPRLPGKPITSHMLANRLRARVEAVGADPAITPKSLRHYCASTLLASGEVPAQRVAALLGHGILETTTRYGVHIEAGARRAFLAHLPSLDAAAADG